MTDADLRSALRELADEWERQIRQRQLPYKFAADCLNDVRALLAEGAPEPVCCPTCAGPTTELVLQRCEECHPMITIGPR